MTNTTKHWTERSIDDYLYKIAADFVDQLQFVMNSKPLSQSELAKQLGITKGRVSQIFNNPGNLTLKQIIRFARALGLHVGLFAYSNDKPRNNPGPINSDIFRILWETAGKPDNFRDLKMMDAYAINKPYVYDLPFEPGYIMNERFYRIGQSSAASSNALTSIITEPSETALTERVEHL